MNKNRRRYLMTMMLCMALSVLTARAQLLAVGTDVVLLGSQTYNASAELTLTERSTLGLGVFGNYHPWVLSDMRCIGVQPEWRYYLSGRPMLYHFVGICGLVSNYDFTWKGDHYHGDAAGAGLTFGYVLPLSQRLSMDFHAGVGLVYYHEKEKSVSNTLLPTKIGISLSYIIR